MKHSTAIVTGASGQDGYFLTERLLAEGVTVFAATRNPAALAGLAVRGNLQPVDVDLFDPTPLFELIRRERPAEIFNLAGLSSVVDSLERPQEAWRTNATFVEQMLEVVRQHSPDSRVYQASSTELFGGSNDPDVVYDETSALTPRTPYAAAKAAAHLLCGAYRAAFGVRVACGILSNHESPRRPERFLSRRVVNHVARVANGLSREVLKIGNPRITRDWGHAADYVNGVLSIARQSRVRGVADDAAEYRDYVLSTGATFSVLEMVDHAFTVAGVELNWQREGEVTAWRADYAVGGDPAVVVDVALIRPGEPLYLKSDPRRAREELGWRPRTGLDPFLRDMFAAAVTERHQYPSS